MREHKEHNCKVHKWKCLPVVFRELLSANTVSYLLPLAHPRPTVLQTAQNLPDSAFTEVKDGERPYALSVTTASTYGNSIFPGNKIDVFMKATDENGQIMVGRLLAQVEVLAVKDSNGNNVFEDSSENRTPSTLLFGVPEDVFVLLKKSEYLKSTGVELFPVPYGGTIPIEGDLTVDRQELVDYIESHTVTFSDTIDTNNGNNSTVTQNNLEINQ